MAKIIVNVQKRLNGASVRANFLYGENIDMKLSKIVKNCQNSQKLSKMSKLSKIV